MCWKPEKFSKSNRSRISDKKARVRKIESNQLIKQVQIKWRSSLEIFKRFQSCHHQSWKRKEENQRITLRWKIKSHKSWAIKETTLIIALKDIENKRFGKINGAIW